MRPADPGKWAVQHHGPDMRRTEAAPGQPGVLPGRALQSAQQEREP